jgi:hypothetical protein
MKIIKNKKTSLSMLAISVIIIVVLITAGCLSNIGPSNQGTTYGFLHVSTEKQFNAYGQMIVINAEFRNTGTQQITLNSTSYQLIITGPQGNILSMSEQRSSIGKINVSANSSIPIFTFRWNQTDMNGRQVAAGEYTITVDLLYDNYQDEMGVFIRQPSDAQGILQVSTDKQNYTVGEGIIINATFFNYGTEQITLYATSYQLEIVGPQGEVLYMGVFGSSLGPINVSAQSELSIAIYTWDQKDIKFTQVPEGLYTIIVTLTDDVYQGQTNIIIEWPPD